MPYLASRHTSAHTHRRFADPLCARHSFLTRLPADNTSQFRHWRLAILRSPRFDVLPITLENAIATSRQCADCLSGPHGVPPFPASLLRTLKLQIILSRFSVLAPAACAPPSAPVPAIRRSSSLTTPGHFVSSPRSCTTFVMLKATVRPPLDPLKCCPHDQDRPRHDAELHRRSQVLFLLRPNRVRLRPILYLFIHAPLSGTTLGDTDSAPSVRNGMAKLLL